MKTSSFADEKGSYFRQRRSWRHRARFWLMASLVCAMASLVAFILYWTISSAPPFLFEPYKDLQQRDIETMDREFRKWEHEERERIKREEGFRERRGERYSDVWKRGGY